MAERLRSRSQSPRSTADEWTDEELEQYWRKRLPPNTGAKPVTKFGPPKAEEADSWSTTFSRLLGTMAGEYKLIYFNFRGRGEVPRLLFALSGTEYEERRVALSEWPELKPKTPYGQVPVLEYNGKQYCQSEAISRFLARQFDLYGKDAVEGLEIDQILGITSDVAVEYIKANYRLKGEEQEKAKESLVRDTLPKYISFLSKVLGSNEYLVGNKVSLADVAVFDFLGDKVPGLVKGWKSGSQAVDDLVNRVGNIPNVKQYVSSRPEETVRPP